MKQIIDTRQQCWLLRWRLIILLLFIAVNNFSITMAAPLPKKYPVEDFDDTVKNYLQHKSVKNDPKLARVELIVQELFERRTRNDDMLSNQPFPPEYSDGQLDEMLPIPSAVIQPGPAREGSRHYIALCHFKICNMGRKRQS